MNDKFSIYCDKAEQAYHKGQYEDSIHYYQKALQIEPHDSDVWHDLGVVYMDKKDGKNALRTLQKALELSEGHDDTLWNDLGSAYFHSEQYDNALRCYERALELNPNSRESLFNVGLTQLNMEANEKALKTFTRYMDQYGTNMSVLMNMAETYLSMERLRMASRYFQQAVEQKPNSPNLLYDIGELYLQYDLPEKAIPFFKKCLLLDANHVSALESMGVAYQSVDPAKSVEAFKKALLLAPHRPEFRYNLAFALDECGFVEAALPYYLEAFEQDVSFVWAALRGAMIQYLLSEAIDSPIELLENALEFHDDNGDLHFLLASFYGMKGEKTKAMQHFRVAIQLMPSNIDKIKSHVVDFILSDDEISDLLTQQPKA